MSHYYFHIRSSTLGRLILFSTQLMPNISTCNDFSLEPALLGMSSFLVNPNLIFQRSVQDFCSSGSLPDHPSWSLPFLKSNVTCKHTNIFFISTLVNLGHFLYKFVASSIQMKSTDWFDTIWYYPFSHFMYSYLQFRMLLRIQMTRLKMLDSNQSVHLESVT